jgi:hypothetical protein
MYQGLKSSIPKYLLCLDILDYIRSGMNPQWVNQDCSMIQSLYDLKLRPTWVPAYAGMTCDRLTSFPRKRESRA